MAPTIIKSVVTPTAGLFTASGGKPYDLIDLPTLKILLNIDVTNTTYDDFLLLGITQTSSTIRRHCNRTFQPQTYQELLWAQRDPYPWQLPSGLEPIQLQEWPIIGPACVAGTGSPLTPGALSSVSGGALAAASYLVRVTYTTPTGETPMSSEASLALAADTLLNVAAPVADPNNIATGWNVYVGNASGKETKQNTSPIAMNSSWTLPSSGLIAGSALPTFVNVIQNANLDNSNFNITPTSLIEGQDFEVDYELGQLTRLFNDDYPRRWEMLPTQVIYQAGFATIPPSVQDACSRMVKAAYYARNRDPGLRQENIEGVYSAAYWFGSGPGSDGAFTPDVAGMLDDYRMPVIG